MKNIGEHKFRRKRENKGPAIQKIGELMTVIA
jgi:hypothetical protein